MRMANGHTVKLAAWYTCADPRHPTALIHQATRTTP